MKEYDYPIYIGGIDNGGLIFLCSVKVNASGLHEDYKTIHEESLRKIARIESVLKSLQIYFNSSLDFKDWLLKENKALDSRAPVDFIENEIDRLEDIVYQIDTGSI